jgi:hypothetical protein
MENGAQPSPEHLRELFHYDPETGVITRRSDGHEVFAVRATRGYLQGNLSGQCLKAHRVAWAIVHGEWPEFIDHINGDTRDNRLANLRDVTKAENARNAKLSKANLCGVAGVYHVKRTGRWAARIKVDGKSIWLGEYPSMDEAAKVRAKAQRDYGFHPNHGRAA